MTSPLAPGSLAGTVAIVTGSSRGIGADTAKYLAAAGASVVVNYRSKAPRAEKVVAEIIAAGGKAIAVSADVTDAASVTAMFNAAVDAFGVVNLLVLNASGGMESGFGEDYAMRLNRDAQVNVAKTALRYLPSGGRIVFVTSHQAHFIDTTPTMDAYEPVARSKRAGEDALRAMIPAFNEAGIGFVVVSGDMIEGTITATLLERSSPGAIAARREDAGRLYNVAEFAAEVTHAAADAIPSGHVRYVGDISGFTKPHGADLQPNSARGA